MVRTGWSGGVDYHINEIGVPVCVEIQMREALIILPLLLTYLLFLALVLVLRLLHAPRLFVCLSVHTSRVCHYNVTMQL